MNKAPFYFLTGIALAACAISAYAQSATVATVPEGLISFTLKHGTTNCLSLPLTNNLSYTGAVSAVTTNTIQVGDTPAPFTAALPAASAPYFVKFLSGNEIGRVIQVTANTASTLTLDITDSSSQTVSLTTSGFNVQAGDTFEVFPADTLASVFGNNTGSSPLLIKAATTQAQADTVSLYSLSSVAWQTYYFSTLKGCWLSPSGANANNTIIYPYAALKVTRLANDTDTSLVLTGRVTEVPLLTKTTGSSAVVYGSTHFATNMTLSQIQLGANWTKSTSASTADTLAVWDATLLQFDSYYQSSTDSTWHSTTNTTANQSSLVIPAGTAISIVQRQTVSGAKSFLASTMPYSLN